MVIEAKKQERETSQSLIRRFTKRVQKSGVLRQARENRYHKRSKSPQMKKRAALRREQLRKEYQRLKKLGLTDKK
ncbi:MAG: 30S ribosomal protein S21 [Candidatus Nealsonbacteria bacterium]|nr:30S ribosomal protein S21 [Candidatus Nealsonbacteria bacterium]